MEWKWSSGEKYEKSQRRQIQIQEKHVAVEQTAIQQSLLSEDDRWVMNQEGQLFMLDQDNNFNNNFNNNISNNKREDTYQKMAEREMVGQIGMNPFMQTNYINDIAVQDNFLKPVSTYVEKEV